MDLGFNSTANNINGINLSDYILDKNSYNPLIYIHKKYFNKGKDQATNETLKSKETHDKSQQYDFEKVCANCYETKVININNLEDKDPVLQQTIKFAKDIIPLTIPAVSTDPVYYTIRCKKSSKRKHEACEPNLNSNRATFDKGKSKVAENIGPEKLKCKRALSTASLTRSSQDNTMDDINENRSLSFSLSESSEHKHFKKDCPKKSRKCGKQKILVSNSFEAIASEYMNLSGEANIKMHLMNEEDKKLFCDNISSPVVKALKGCFSEFSNQKEEIKDIFKAIKNQAIKLDNVFEKLSHIENKLEKITSVQRLSGTAFQESKSAKLEEISRDLVNVREYLSSEEELAYVDLKDPNGKSASLTSIHRPKDMSQIDKCNALARGENISENLKVTKLGAHLERPNRIPARFCWTESAKKPL